MRSIAIPHFLAAWVDLSRRFAWIVTVGALLLAAGGLFYSFNHLSITTNTDEMFSPQLPWRQEEIAFSRDFPQFSDLLVIVIDSAVPEEAEATASSLAQKLSADRTHFNSVRRPDASPFFTKEGLLFLSTQQLTDLLNRTIDAQPFLGQLAADPSARGLFSALGLMGKGVVEGQADLKPYTSALETFHRVMADALAGHPHPLSWTALLSGDLSELAGKYKFVLAQPKLDYSSLEPGGQATAAVRAAAASLEFVKSGSARVRITGDVALADTQFATVAQGAVAGLVASFALIAVWLFLAVHSWRLIVPMLLTLILGLALTLSFAGAAVGTLNVISIAFGILFVGIAVDFAIQFSVRYRQSRLNFPDLTEALCRTASRSGSQILVAAAATSAGFLSFVPTSFIGVAELGLIAGVGMLIAFVCTLTFLPAVITLFRPRGENAPVGFRWAARLDPVIARWRYPLLVFFSCVAVLGCVMGMRITFDSDPLDTQDPNTEAMRTLRDLINSPVTNPYTIDILLQNAGQVPPLAEQLKKLPTVSQVVSIASFIPDQQDEKLTLIADANNILAPTIAPGQPTAPVTPNDIRAAARTALDQIDPALSKLSPNDPLASIAGDLRELETASDSVVMGVNWAVTRFLPMELDRLRDSLSAGPVTLESLPDDLKRDWVLPNGRARVQVVPAANSRDSRGLHRFVSEVRSVAPDAGGSAVTIIESSDTIVNAFRNAAIYAVIAIAVILLIALRRIQYMLMVIAPLILSALMTAIVIVALHRPLNYANIIALPLLLGVGVSFNIYFVMNWRTGRTDILGSATARAVLFSALTTGTAFGSIAVSAHPGTASMGELLLISLGCTLVASMIFEPALLTAMPPPVLPRRRPVIAQQTG
ncbi:MAG: MMPL family transporter [Acetobacteraceae bacterium]|nr:MMPL family transporter [Acetobacteraceae bacterium]